MSVCALRRGSRDHTTNRIWPTAHPRQSRPPYLQQATVNAGADVCLAFPLENSRSTRDTAPRAVAAGIELKFPLA